MKDLESSLQTLLAKQLAEQGYDKVDIVPIPARADRMVRLRTLEDALTEFETADGDGAVGYLIQARPRRAPIDIEPSAADSEPAVRSASPSPPPFRHGTAHTWDGLYQPNGKLNIPFLSRNADLLLASGDSALARNVYRAILQSGERSALAHFGIARTFEAEEKLPEAIDHYRESITFHASLDVYRRLATLLTRQGKPAEAAEVLERAASLKSIDTPARLDLMKLAGTSWLKANRVDLAEKLYRRALDLDPLSDSVRAELGTLFVERENFAEARKFFSDALAANPDNVKALSGLGTCLYAQGNKKAAHDAFARALELNLNNPTAIYYLVKCAYEIKSYAIAARNLGEYVQIAPVNANLLYSLAGLQFHLGRIPESRRTVERILELQPDHAGARELSQIIERYSVPGPGTPPEGPGFA